MLNSKSDILHDQIDDGDNNDNERDLLRWQAASIDYLIDVIENYLDNIWHGVNDFYSAPNGKVYEVVVDSMNIYTSPDFSYPKFFPTRAAFKKHIDDRNPLLGQYNDTNYSHGSATLNWSIVTAPNGKTYSIYQKNSLWSSSNFIYNTSFSTQDWIIKYIEINNPGK
jgi:hypothetical protein